MPNLQCIQGSTTVNGSAANSTTQVGLMISQPVTSNIQGITPASYAWTLSVPATSSTAALSSANDATPTWTPDVAGNYLLTLNGTYTLPLNVGTTSPNVYSGPIVPAFLLASQAPVPAQGVGIISDSANAGSLLTTDANGNHAPVALVRSGTTGARPVSPAIGLYVGFQYWDSTLSKPVYWNGSVWKDATGATV
jgi:hypothetical protein